VSVPSAAVLAVWVAASIGPGVLLSQESPLYVGVLEPRVTDSSDPEPFHVRIVFAFRRGRWSSMPHEAGDEEALAKLSKVYPPRVSWTVAFDGKKLGAVESLQRTYSTYGQVGTEDLTADSAPPEITTDAEAFATWLGVSEFRPLVVVSRPNFTDPDHWKPFRPPAELGTQAHPAFRKAVPRLQCEDQEVPYTDDDILLLDKAYRSSGGDVLLALRAAPSNDHCESNEDAWDSAWFLFARQEFHFVGTGLTLLDAGDYDGDGTSEIIFQESGYNRDGYMLFHPGTKSKVEFGWSYH
jgi:hypothetical protein